MGKPGRFRQTLSNVGFYHRCCDDALKEATRAIIEMMHGKQLVTQSYMVCEALNKAV